MLSDPKANVLWGSPKTWPGFFDEAKRLKGRSFQSMFRMSLSEGSQSTLVYHAIASKKGVSLSSVKRHRAKRRLKAAVRFIFQQKEVFSSDIPPIALEWVLLSSRQVPDCSWEQLLEDAELALKQILKSNREPRNADKIK